MFVYLLEISSASREATKIYSTPALVPPFPENEAALALFSSRLDESLIRYYHFKDLSINPAQCLIHISTRYR